MAAGPVSERNQDATIYVGGLDEKVSHAFLLHILWLIKPPSTYVGGLDEKVPHAFLMHILWFYKMRDLLELK